MGFALTEEHEQFRTRLRSFFEREAPIDVVARHDRDEEFNQDLYRKAADLGLCGLAFPDEYGGSDADQISICIAVEEVARATAPLAYAWLPTATFCAMGLARFGTDEQRKLLLPRIAEGHLRMAMGLTEPGAGGPHPPLHPGRSGRQRLRRERPEGLHHRRRQREPRAVRQTDHRTPGSGAHARRHGDGRRNGPAHHLERGLEAGAGVRLHPGGVDGQGLGSEAGTRCASRGMQILGGYSYMVEYGMERYWRETKLYEIAGGTNEILRNVITRRLAR